MKKRLKNFLLPILLVILPLSASAVTTTMTAHIGKMNMGDVWIVSGESEDSLSIGKIIGKWNQHTDTFVHDYNVTKITYCADSKKKCMPGGDIYTDILCPLIDHTQGKSSDSKIDVYLYPDHDFCQAVKYSV